MKQVHLGEGLLCEHCSKSFPTKSKLSCHVQVVHLGEKYTCDHCGKSYTQKITLTTLAIPHAQKPPNIKCHCYIYIIFLDIVYHTHTGDNWTKSGDPNSIIPDFHILGAQNALKKLQKSSKKAKKYFFEKSQKNASTHPRGEANCTVWADSVENCDLYPPNNNTIDNVWINPDIFGENPDLGCLDIYPEWKQNLSRHTRNIQTLGTYGLCGSYFSSKEGLVAITVQL